MPRLTKRAVETARPESGRDVFLWDATLPGFGLRVKPSGARSYVAQYRTWSGRSKRMTLGRHGILTVDEARSAARQILASAARGADPAGEKAAARRAITFSEFADRYLEQHATPKKKASSAATDRRNLGCTYGPRSAPSPSRRSVGPTLYGSIMRCAKRRAPRTASSRCSRR